MIVSEGLALRREELPGDAPSVPADGRSTTGQGDAGPIVVSDRTIPVGDIYRGRKLLQGCDQGLPASGGVRHRSIHDVIGNMGSNLHPNFLTPTGKPIRAQRGLT